MSEYETTTVIPVLFDLTAPAGTSELETANELAELLKAARLPGSRKGETMLESWWMPNHPEGDGSDNEAIVLVIPTNVITNQSVVDDMLGTIARWNGGSRAKAR